MSGGSIVREARLRAGLTQVELADRAGTTQPGIARWESGRTSMSLEGVRRLVRLCGFEFEVAIVPREGSDLAQAERLADLTPDQRLRRHQRLLSQMRSIRAADG